jgi:lysosomal acid phosphatase
MRRHLPPLAALLCGAALVCTAAAQLTDGTAETAAAVSPTPEPSPTVNPHPERELLLAVELCRHGDRAPLYSYPLDTLPLSKWPEGVGQLTAVGQRAHYELGALLRKRYVSSGFLRWAFQASEVYVRSTTIDRALMSAYSQMVGLYPAGSAALADVGTAFGGDSPSENSTGLPSRWQPVPIHSVPVEADGLLIAGANCPRHQKLMAAKTLSAEWTSRMEKENGYLKQLGAIVGSAQPLTLHDVNAINDIWRCYEAHGVPLQEGVTRAVRQRAHDIATWMLVFGNEGHEVRRLRSGLLLNEIKQRMLLAGLRREDKLPKNRIFDAKKFVLYSAHDTTVAAALAALGLELSDNPPYNSTLIWEFWRDTVANKYLVTIEFNGVAQHVPGCPGKPACEFDPYVEATQAVTLDSTTMRMRECMTGFRRQAALMGSWFASDPVDEFNSGAEHGLSGVSSLDTSGTFSVARVIVLLALLCLAAFAASKAKSQYVHYFLLKPENAAESNRSVVPSVVQGSHDSRILL